METVRSRLLKRAAERKLSLSELSLTIGKNHAYLQQFIKRGVPSRLSEDVRVRVAQVLNMDEQELIEHAEAPSSITSIKIRAREQRTSTWLPVCGQAIGGADGEFVFDGYYVTKVLAPASLLHVPNAYAVVAVGESMEPRYFEGETLFVDPRLPIERGAFVVAQISLGEYAVRAYVKRFVSRDANHLRLEQYNPKKSIEFEISEVIAVHRIVMSGIYR